MSKFIEIYDPKKRNEIIEENLRLRNKLKNKFEEQDNIQNKVENNRIELFKPIIESNKKIQNEFNKDRNKIIATLNNFKIEDSTVKKQLAIENNPISNIIVSSIIANYLKDLRDRSNAGYSIKYNSEKD
jgi:hypothetical protein